MLKFFVTAVIMTTAFLFLCAVAYAIGILVAFGLPVV